MLQAINILKMLVLSISITEDYMAMIFLGVLKINAKGTEQNGLVISAFGSNTRVILQRLKWFLRLSMGICGVQMLFVFQNRNFLLND